MIQSLAVIGILIGILMVGTTVNHWDSINKVSSEFEIKGEFSWLTPIIKPFFWIAGRFADIGFDLGTYLYPHQNTFILFMLSLSLLGFAFPAILTTVFVIYFVIKQRKEIWADFKRRK